MFRKILTLQFAVTFMCSLSMAVTAPFQLQCDGEGNVSEITNDDGSTTTMRLGEHSDVIAIYCAELTACTRSLKNTPESMKDFLAIAKKLSADPPAGSETSSVGKMAMLSEMKRLRNGIEHCQTLLEKKDPRKLKIGYPGKGPNKAIRSDRYDYQTMRHLIQLALLNGVDPFLVLSISAIESPRMTNNTNVSGYESGYGDLPIDGLPVFDKLGCVYSPKSDAPLEYATSDEADGFKKLIAVRNQSENSYNLSDSQKINDFRQYLFTNDSNLKLLETVEGLLSSSDCKPKGIPQKTADKFCKTPGLREAGKNYLSTAKASLEMQKFETRVKARNPKAFLELSAKYDKSTAISIVPAQKTKTFQLPWGGTQTHTLCTDPRPYAHGQPAVFATTSKPSNDKCCVNVTGVVDGDDVRREFLNAMAIDFAKTKMKFSKGPLDQMSYDIQPYNGMGCIGCTEGLGNDCMQGLHMGTRPYYGARVADLMINSMMANPEIRALVAEAARELGEPVKNAFCQKNGAGKVALQPELFYEQQREFLLNGAEGKIRVGDRDVPYKALVYKGKIGVPASTEEREAFVKAEQNRSRLCEKHFK